jgi:hypothetical protein
MVCRPPLFASRTGTVELVSRAPSDWDDGWDVIVIMEFCVEDSIVTRSPKHLIVSGAVFPATHNSNDDNKSTRKKPLLKMRFLRSAYIRSTYSSEAADKQRHIEVCQHVLVESKQL